MIVRAGKAGHHPEGHLDRSSGRGELYRVGQQVGQDLLYLARVQHRHAGGLILLQNQSYPLLRSRVAHHAHRLLDKKACIRGRKVRGTSVPLPPWPGPGCR
ncbi:MAG: hypothetical protein MZV64_09235 [Ignavibacteriales bacterium]|nr:hypothetical protein [Ignavibacteriales bacterium]